MKCPWCSEEMIHGYLTGNQMFRLMPEPETPKQTRRLNNSLPPSQYETGINAIVLDVPYAGLAPWIPADYCRACKKVIFEAGVIGKGENA